MGEVSMEIAAELLDAAQAIRNHIPDEECAFHAVATSKVDSTRSTLAGIPHAELLERAAKALSRSPTVADEEGLIANDSTVPPERMTTASLGSWLSFIAGWAVLKEVGEGKDLRAALLEASRRLSSLQPGEGR